MLDPRRSLHILTMGQSFHDGGVERAMLRLVRGWVAAGARVTLVMGEIDGPHANELPPGVELITVGRSYFRLLATLPRLVKEARPDIVFCPGNHYTAVAAWIRLRLGRACPPIVAKVSNQLDRPDQVFPVRQGYPLWLRAHRFFIDHLVAMTPAMAAETGSRIGMGADRLSVIPNPPTLDRRVAPRPAVQGDYLIGIGRLSPQKRWDRAIAAFARIARDDVPLVILGEGETRPALERQVAALGLSDRVRLPGYANDPFPTLAGARALVLSSDFEGVPGVIQEALALGVPVVTTESSVAIREIVADSRHGSVVAAEDGEAMVAALDHWLDPATPRIGPIAPEGADAVDRYLELFDRMVRPG